MKLYSYDIVKANDYKVIDSTNITARTKNSNAPRKVFAYGVEWIGNVKTIDAGYGYYSFFYTSKSTPDYLGVNIYHGYASNNGCMLKVFEISLNGEVVFLIDYKKYKSHGVSDGLLDCISTGRLGNYATKDLLLSEIENIIQDDILKEKEAELVNAKFVEGRILREKINELKNKYAK